MPENNKKQPVIIRKYANRRLYNTEISSYVTLDDLYAMVKRGEDFVVLDAKTNEDFTKSVLTQIIFEQENGGGENMLSIEFLRSLISFYDDSMKNVMPVYLNSMMQAFIQKQEEMRKKLSGAMTGGTNFNPFKQFEEMYKSVWGNQQQMFNNTMGMFNPLNKK
jgi:polyhydroxyalkanoate synthesis repressor PhaR